MLDSGWGRSSTQASPSTRGSENGPGSVHRGFCYVERGKCLHYRLQCIVVTYAHVVCNNALLTFKDSATQTLSQRHTLFQVVFSCEKGFNQSGSVISTAQTTSARGYKTWKETWKVKKNKNANELLLTRDSLFRRRSLSVLLCFPWTASPRWAAVEGRKHKEGLLEPNVLYLHSLEWSQLACWSLALTSDEFGNFWSELGLDFGNRCVQPDVFQYTHRPKEIVNLSFKLLKVCCWLYKCC